MYYICTMEEKKLEILEQASSVYMRLGIKSVTMDDLARELSMSKKTLYKYFKDKSDLVNTIIDYKLEMNAALTLNCHEQSDNAIDDLLGVSKMIVQMFKNINPTVFYDLNKNYPDAWKKLYDHKWSFVRNLILKNIHKGIEQGIYRKNLNPEILANLYVSSTNSMMDVSVFPWPEFKLDEVVKEVIAFHIYGMVNEKGFLYINQILENETND